MGSIRSDTRQNSRIVTRLRASSIAIVLLSSMTLAACSGDDEQIEYVERPVETIYNIAVEKLSERNYRDAALYFDEVERQHPYSVWARRAMLMSAYCYYQYNKYDESILAAERFIGLHPGNRDAPYAYYLIAISYYEQISDVGRDQEMTQKALKSLREVVRRYPESEYARDSRLKIDMTVDHLAGKEMDIGRYYLQRGQYVAAINRFRNVIETYQTTTHVPEALHRLTEAYLSLGINSEAQSSAAVLGYNFPGSEWYEDSYALLTERDLRPVDDEKSWIARAFGGIGSAVDWIF